MPTNSTHSSPTKQHGGGALSPERRKHAKEAFLIAFAKYPIISYGCEQAGIERDTFYAWMEHDEGFALRYHQAEAASTDSLVQEAYRRARDGTARALVSGGRVVKDEQGNIVMQQEYSDQILLRLMNFRVPGFKETANGADTAEQSGARDALLQKLAALGGAHED